MKISAWIAYQSESAATLGGEGIFAKLGRGLCALPFRAFLRRPADSIGITVAALAAGAIAANALFMQPSAHPAPIFPGSKRPVGVADATGSVVPMLPRPRPPEAGSGVTEAPTLAAATTAPAPMPARTRTQIISDIQRELARRGFFDGPIDGAYGPKTDAAIRDFEQAAGLKNAEPDEALLRAIVRSTAKAQPASPPAAAAAPTAAPRPAATPSKRVLAVQRALGDYGYGQLAANGLFGPDTKAAIERFERERKLPVTGQVSDRLLRELAAMTGRPLE